MHDDTRPSFELMKLQARSREGDGGDWTDIFPAQLQWVAKNGFDVRALSVTEPLPEPQKAE